MFTIVQETTSLREAQTFDAAVEQAKTRITEIRSEPRRLSSPTPARVKYRIYELVGVVEEAPPLPPPPVEVRDFRIPPSEEELCDPPSN